MGWMIELCFHPRQVFFDKLTADFTTKQGDRVVCLKKLYRGAPFQGVLYTLWHRCDKDGHELARYVVVYLIALFRPEGWGYKDMSHDMCPYKFACPLSWLEGLTLDSPSARKWVDCVKEYWAARREKRPSRIAELVQKEYT